MQKLNRLEFRNGRAGPLLLTAAVHLALYWGWHSSRHGPGTAAPTTREAIQWSWLRERPPAPAPVPSHAQQKVPSAARSAVAHASRSNAPVEVPQAEPAHESPQALEPARLIDRLAQAKGELGKIDAQIRRERERRGLISAPPDSPLLRMQRKMTEAADAAPNKWYEAPKVSEIIDPGGYGRRRYKVVSPGGTYCITVESNHAPDGLDTMKNGIKPKITNCPPNEEPATRQAW